MFDGCSFFCWVISVIERWQTLLTGIIALAAAWWTITVIQREIEIQKSEIEATERRHLDQRERKLLAIRAQMPDALSGLVLFTRECMAFARGIQDSKPDIPREHIGVFKDSIEFVDNESAKSIYEMVSFFQVHNARLFSEKSKHESFNLSDRIYDSTLMYAYLNRVFEYARNESEFIDSTNPSKQEMISSLRQCVGLVQYLNSEKTFQEVINMIERRHTDNGDEPEE